MHTANEKMQFLWKSFSWLSMEEFPPIFFFLDKNSLEKQWPLSVHDRAEHEVWMQEGNKEHHRMGFPLAHLGPSLINVSSGAPSGRPPVILQAQGMSSFGAFHFFKLCLQYFLWGWSSGRCLCPQPWSDQWGLRIHFWFIFFPLSVLTSSSYFLAT